MVVDSLRAF